MTTKLAIPPCPRCGEPARVVVLRAARVRCAVNADGTHGKVLSVTREAKEVVGYECGGGHDYIDPKAEL